DHLNLHSFPTRRSSDLRKTSGPPQTSGPGAVVSQNKPNGDVPQTPQPKSGGGSDFFSELAAKIESRNTTKNCKADTVSTSSSSRSEEHTSELQSRENLV